MQYWKETIAKTNWVCQHSAGRCFMDPNGVDKALLLLWLDQLVVRKTSCCCCHDVLVAGLTIVLQSIHWKFQMSSCYSSQRQETCIPYAGLSRVLGSSGQQLASFSWMCHAIWTKAGCNSSSFFVLASLPCICHHPHLHLLPDRLS
jgi:hypothetical protein